MTHTNKIAPLDLYCGIQTERQRQTKKNLQSKLNRPSPDYEIWIAVTTEGR